MQDMHDINNYTSIIQSCLILFVAFHNLVISSISYFLPGDYSALTGLHLLTCLVPVPDT